MAGSSLVCGQTVNTKLLKAQGGRLWQSCCHSPMKAGQSICCDLLSSPVGKSFEGAESLPLGWNRKRGDLRIAMTGAFPFSVPSFPHMSNEEVEWGRCLFVCGNHRMSSLGCVRCSPLSECTQESPAEF